MTTAGPEADNTSATKTPPSLWSGLTGKIVAVTGVLLAVGALIDAVSSVGTKTQPVICSLVNSAGFSPSFCSNKQDKDETDLQTALAAGTTGWIYVGTRIGDQWRKSAADGSEPALTIDTSGLPARGQSYTVTNGVYLRAALPEKGSSDRPLMPDSKGALMVGSSVKVHDVREIKLDNPARVWIWAHVTYLR